MQLLRCCHHLSLKYLLFDVVIGQVKKLTCRESFKIPGRHHAIIVPCMSTIMEGFEIIPAAVHGGYDFLKEFSAFFAVSVPEFPGLLDTLSA